MRVFVTGAAGFIGQATVRELLQNGHQVLALVRTDAQAETLSKAGADPHKGDLKDLESLRSGAKAADGVIHLAFIHDFSDFAGGCATDRAAIEAMGQALGSTGKPLVIASGTGGLPLGTLVTEDTEHERNTFLSDRVKSADLVIVFSKGNRVRGSVIRLAPTVHGAGDKAFIPQLINLSRQNGSVIYIGNGSARWPAVHRDDAAVLFRLALKKGSAGAVYHAVAEQGVPMKDVWTLVGKHLRLPVHGQSTEEAVAALGIFGHVIGMDNPTSSEKTKKELAWHPAQIGLLADMEANYFS